MTESAGDGTSGGTSGGGEVRDEGSLLPMANIERIMKKALPANTKITQDAKELVQICATEFIHYITSAASNKCRLKMGNREIIDGHAILYSINTFQFHDFEATLQGYLNEYRQRGEEHGPITIGEDDEGEAEMTVFFMGRGQQNEDPNRREAAMGERQHQIGGGGRRQ